MPATRGEALALALAAHADLTALAETVEDEWTYVSTLAEAGRAILHRSAGPETGLPVPPSAAAAVVAAAAEARRIADPHRAIDWLSTFPAVVELALAGPPSPGSGAAGGSPAGAAGRSPAGAAGRSPAGAAGAPGGGAPDRGVPPGGGVPREGRPGASAPGER